MSIMCPYEILVSVRLVFVTFREVDGRTFRSFLHHELAGVKDASVVMISIVAQSDLDIDDLSSILLA